ncbi:MAG: MTH865 family protein [Halobacteriota archaeon]|uniref:MTH865 family protein n=1 Tax=Natronomonas sp. TaxID=2184060 RepID=UPI003976EB76
MSNTDKDSDTESGGEARTETETELREQFFAAIEAAEYPIEDQIGAVSALPNGMTTRFEAGEFSMSAASIAAHLYTYQSFPYETPEAFVNDLMDGLRAEDLI